MWRGDKIMAINLETQVNLIRDVLEFNKKVTILNISPSAEELESIRNKCSQIPTFKFDTTASDVDLIEQISAFADTYK